MSHKKVIIVGGGLAGLYAAYLLDQQRIPYILLEAQSRLGGRILGAQSKQNTSHYFDLGPAWIFPHQKKIQALVKQLGISLFSHYATGYVLHQMSEKQPPRLFKGTDDLQLLKIQGGTQSLIHALQTTIEPNNIQLNHVITNIERGKHLWRISATHNGIVRTFSGDELMLAMPPRIIARFLTEQQWISKLLLTDLQHSQTWMAGQAKFVATYATPFWRQKGLSGQIFSQTGPMTETHDASTDTNQNYGLFGFIGWTATRRSRLTQQQLKDACVAQLVSCYGPDAYNFSECYLKDWATDQFICTTNDSLEASRHPQFTLSSHRNELNTLHLHFIGSEFANIDPGYLEGALDAVEQSILGICN
ncbi:MAG: FAD-dependent oxidoreductase [Sinobacterium sp.]